MAICGRQPSSQPDDQHADDDDADTYEHRAGSPSGSHPVPPPVAIAERFITYAEIVSAFGIISKTTERLRLGRFQTGRSMRKCNWS